MTHGGSGGRMRPTPAAWPGLETRATTTQQVTGARSGTQRTTYYCTGPVGKVQ